MAKVDAAQFVDTVRAYYQEHGRHDLPWRQPMTDGTFDPYRILVSEVMLQQTQVGRVFAKFTECIDRYPNSYALARASLEEVLALWSGLGYNRRAKYLWQAARLVEAEYNGVFPEDQQALTKLPGVGMHTAGAICAYAWNQPTVFLETNIRTVFIHHFFPDDSSVRDADLLPLVAATVPSERVREWYWALMDYGTFIKQTVGNAARVSTTYNRQSAFEGSRRQLRGSIIRTLLERPTPLPEFRERLHDNRLEAVLDDLVREGMIARTPSGYVISRAL